MISDISDVRGLAIAALNLFTGEGSCDGDVVRPYLQGMLSALCTTMNPSMPVEVQEQALEGKSLSLNHTGGSDGLDALIFLFPYARVPY